MCTAAPQCLSLAAVVVALCVIIDLPLSAAWMPSEMVSHKIINANTHLTPAIGVLSHHWCTLQPMFMTYKQCLSIKTAHHVSRLQGSYSCPIQGQYTRRTPLGFDRHWNRYWLLGGTDDGGSPRLYVERTTPVWHGEVGMSWSGHGEQLFDRLGSRLGSHSGFTYQPDGQCLSGDVQSDISLV